MRVSERYEICCFVTRKPCIVRNTGKMNVHQNRSEVNRLRIRRRANPKDKEKKGKGKKKTITTHREIQHTFRSAAKSPEFSTTSFNTALHLHDSSARAYTCAGGDLRSLFPKTLDLKLPPAWALGEPEPVRTAAASW